MGKGVCWVDDLAKAKETAKKTNKPILLDFFNPQWLGCQKMGAVTYPNEGVAKFVELNFVPVQVEITNKEMTDKYSVTWTPSILVLDADGKEHYRSVGFVPPDEFIARFTVGKGRFHLGTDQVALARAEFEEAVERCPHPNVLPEAIYWKGVATYKHTQDPKHLRAAYDALTAKYPQSDWAQRAEPYKTIEA